MSSTLSPIRSAAHAAGHGHSPSTLAGDRAKIIVKPLIDKVEKKKDQSAFGRFIAKLTGKGNKENNESAAIGMCSSSIRSSLLNLIDVMMLMLVLYSNDQ
jgi:hypothetical protein